MIKIVEVESNKDLKSFIDFPHELYKSDPNYVPALYMSEKHLLTKHPFHHHSEMSLFLAYKNGKIAGRIAAILNVNYNTFHKDSVGFFGFFESTNDFNVAEKLFEVAEKWLKAKKAVKIIGPVNPSTNESCGYLVEGKNEPPVVMMPYNQPYYHDLFLKMGFHKNTDLLAYLIDVGSFQDKSVKMLDLLSQRLSKRGIIVRKVNLKYFKKEIAECMTVYNEAWDKNLGFVPMTDEEFEQMANDAKMILDPDFCLVAEYEGKAIGFTLCIPDINQIQIKMKKGRLFPFGIFKLLLGRKKIKKLRVLALGVKEEYRRVGIEAVLYGTLLKNAREKGIVEAEASWILEENQMMNRALENLNGHMYKRYRIVEKAIL
ncbi:GNAT family N-acetyltransferase [Chryseobacterium lathyri]|uniref:GNAT superfamily N-acetyltransferase n=1 Tax=Chryseobacterium lathyri TaxID=395933 RepID=A0ABT9SQY5_9FLAO|nr:GNAT family N-acetyltransferase [Chryseobacterium lathyri]MDP9961853.1 GNAT superfamily N-acetyltransferase [Chryseobacterium lathyri]